MLDNDVVAAVMPAETYAAREASILSPAAGVATVFAGDYLNKLTGESVERECRAKIASGAKELIVNFSRTEIVNSIGVSILLGVIDAARSCGARVVFADVNENTAELFEMLGLTKHVQIV
ncbi:MAG: STAS domain-containing protein [Pyrinomonadaceae bacterium]